MLAVVSYAEEAIEEVQRSMATQWTAAAKLTSIFLTASEFIVDNFDKQEPLKPDTRNNKCDCM